MSFTEAIRTCFSKYVTIEGRARRSEYWWFLLFGLIGGLVFGAIDGVVFGPDSSILSGLFSLGIFLPTLCAAIRRLHDRDMSGWWVLLYLVPLIGLIVLLIIYALPGTEGPNRFGPSPFDTSGDTDNDTDQYSRSSIPRAGRE